MAINNKDKRLFEHKIDFGVEDEILSLMSRQKRSDMKQRENKTAFYHTKDEINEDTLKHQNLTGTLAATRLQPVTRVSRRKANLKTNKTESLQIEYTPRIYEQLTHNKIDVTHEDNTDNIVRSKLSQVTGNYSQVAKNKDLTKVVVSELSSKDEVIGDKTGPIISNITFQPENQTFTAMALIAGSLLYKLWNMEKDGTGDYIDTEMLRHEKITDLLEIFKEPLNINQELFLKNALDQITSALDKNKGVQNVSICQSVEDIKNIMIEKETEKPILRNNASNDDTAEDNIAELINKYEAIQNKLDILKKTDKQEPKILTTDEKSSLNKFGKILETIATGLLPNKSKKMVSKMNNLNLFSNDNVKLKQLFNIDIGNMSVSTKDKIVLDYLNHIQSKPKCLLDSKKNIEPPNVEGNILLNLSEFLKIKSIADLVKLVKVEDKVEEVITENLNTVTTTDVTERIELKPMKRMPETPTDKLKAHLKTIMDDIIEIQKIDEKYKDSKIKDVLPCLYKILDIGKPIKTENEQILKIGKSIKIENEPKTNPTEKLKKIFENLKRESAITSNRRVNTLNGPRPKSAVIWDRVISNIEKKKLNTRRNMNTHTITDIKQIIQKIDTNSNSYKNYAYLHEVPASERLLLLKTLDTDTLKYIKLLQAIKSTLNIQKIPTQDYKTVSEFIEDASNNINLNVKVVQNLDKVNEVNLQGVKTKLANKIRNVATESKFSSINKLRDVAAETIAKFNKEQIINQVIKNRVQAYIKVKEAKGEINDINYDIAQKILTHIELGNNGLARELFKIFVYEKQKNNVNKNRNKESKVVRPKRPTYKEPLIQFKSSEQTQKLDKDQLIKQLLSLRNIKF